MRANSLHGELCHSARNSARNSTTFTKTNHSYLACNILSFYSDAEVIFHHHSGKGCWGSRTTRLFLQPVCLATRDPRTSTPSNTHSARPLSCRCDAADRFPLTPMPSRIHHNLLHVSYCLYSLHRQILRTTRTR